MDQNKWGLNKSQRMQLKAFVCLLGILLLVVLLLGKLILMIIHREEEELPMPHVPVIQIYRNVWVMEADGLPYFGTVSVRSIRGEKPERTQREMCCYIAPRIPYGSRWRM